MVMTRARTVVLCALLSGCTGSLIGEPQDAGAGGGSDSGVWIMLDDGGGPPPGTDAGTPPPGTDAGPPVGTDAGPPGPCDGVTCGANAECDPMTGACACDDGFIPDGSSGCVMLPPGDPAGRTQAEVCAQWNDGHVENSSMAWTAGAGTCDAGTMDPVAIDDTLRRIAMFRWLAGLPPVDHDASRHGELMECANMMNVNGSLSHNPPMSWTCWTSGGAAAAGRSNIALGYRTPGSAIDGYMSDRNTPSLGHRRWILGARLGSVEIGFAGRGQCLGVFGGGGSTDRPWTAYPNQGFAPLALAQYTWSFHGNTVSLPSSAYATVQRMSDGMELPVDSYLTGGGGPPPTVGFTPMGWEPAAGETYRVTIHGTSDGDIVYETTLVDC